jgi:hypothetical protein
VQQIATPKVRKRAFWRQIHQGLENIGLRCIHAVVAHVSRIVAKG